MPIVRLSETLQRIFKLFDTPADADAFARVCREDWAPDGCDMTQKHQWCVCRACDVTTGEHCGYVVTDEWGRVISTEFYEYAMDVRECNE